MAWVRALSQTDLQPGDRRVVAVGGQRLLLLHHLGQVFALDSACPHMRLPLQWGKLGDDCSLTCPWHRSAFDLRTGDVKAWSPWPPGVGTILGSLARQRTLPVFRTKLEDGAVWVDV